jgi:S-adenosylmethionine decarboxylase proenzyme
MYGIDLKLLNDSEYLIEHLKKGIEASGATLCSLQVKEFQPRGLTILALLAESHASIHTYPEYASLFFDVFTCGDHCVPLNIAKELAEALKPQHQKFKKIIRGDLSDDSMSYWTHST